MSNNDEKVSEQVQNEKVEMIKDIESMDQQNATIDDQNKYNGQQLHDFDEHENRSNQSRSKSKKKASIFGIQDKKHLNGDKDSKTKSVRNTSKRSNNRSMQTFTNLGQYENVLDLQERANMYIAEKLDLAINEEQAKHKDNMERLRARVEIFDSSLLEEVIVSQVGLNDSICGSFYDALLLFLSFSCFPSILSCFYKLSPRYISKCKNIEYKNLYITLPHKKLSSRSIRLSQKH